MLSPLQLRQHLFTEVAIGVVEDGVPDGEAKFEHKLQYGSSRENPLLWRAELKVTISSNNETPFNYSGTVSITGIFEVHPDFPKERAEELIRVNGAGILFGAIREMVLNITCRSSKGPLVLPTLNFQLAERVEVATPTRESVERPGRPVPVSEQ
jgi:preprotein translocase subunit SecB